MSYSVDQESCTGCLGCLEACPAEAIESNGGVATIDDCLCILCGACQANCPQNAVLLMLICRPWAGQRCGR